MSDTARDILDFQSVSTDGLEELYEQTENHVESLDSRLVLTASEASIYLGIPISTLYRRIKAGKFETRVAEDGALRIILPTETAGENHPILTSQPSENQKQAEIPSDSQRVETENQSLPVFSNAQFESLLAIVAEKDRKLEAATYRVGYLEAQLEGKDREIKLLTDSQHKPSWWQRFKAFFVKQ
jgi:hypothetical protein